MAENDRRQRARVFKIFCFTLFDMRRGSATAKESSLRGHAFANVAESRSRQQQPRAAPNTILMCVFATFFFLECGAPVLNAFPPVLHTRIFFVCLILSSLCQRRWNNIIIETSERREKRRRGKVLNSQFALTMATDTGRRASFSLSFRRCAGRCARHVCVCVSSAA